MSVQFRGSENSSRSARKPRRAQRAADAPWPEDLEEERSTLEQLDFLSTDLNDPAYWRRLNTWIESTGVQVYTLTELADYVGWVTAKHPNRKSHRAGFRNWLKKEVRDQEERSRRRYQDDRRR